MTKSPGFAPLPYSGNDASMIKLEGATKASQADVDAWEASKGGAVCTESYAIFAQRVGRETQSNLYMKEYEYTVRQLLGPLNKALRPPVLARRSLSFDLATKPDKSVAVGVNGAGEIVSIDSAGNYVTMSNVSDPTQWEDKAQSVTFEMLQEPVAITKEAAKSLGWPSPRQIWPRPNPQGFTAAYPPESREWVKNFHAECESCALSSDDITAKQVEGIFRYAYLGLLDDLDEESVAAHRWWSNCFYIDDSGNNNDCVVMYVKGAKGDYEVGHAEKCEWLGEIIWNLVIDREDKEDFDFADCR